MNYDIVLIILIIFIGFFTLLAGIGAAPSVPTPKKMMRKMVKAMNIKKGRIYYDLGAGYGGITKEVTNQNGIAIGFELTPSTYLFSRFRFIFNKNAKIYWKNFYKQSYKNASGIFCFLSPKAMERLEKKFEAELNRGDKVVSYAFQLPNKKPKDIIKTKGLANIYVYEY